MTKCVKSISRSIPGAPRRYLADSFSESRHFAEFSLSRSSTDAAWRVLIKHRLVTDSNSVHCCRLPPWIPGYGVSGGHLQPYPGGLKSESARLLPTFRRVWQQSPRLRLSGEPRSLRQGSVSIHRSAQGVLHRDGKTGSSPWIGERWAELGLPSRE